MSTPETVTKAPAKCYHLWVLSSSGNGLFRRQRCFTSRAAANNAGKRYGYNDPITDAFLPMNGAQRPHAEALQLLLQNHLNALTAFHRAVHQVPIG